MTDEPTVEEQALALADEVLSLRARLRAQDDEIDRLRALVVMGEQARREDAADHMANEVEVDRLRAEVANLRRLVRLLHPDPAPDPRTAEWLQREGLLDELRRCVHAADDYGRCSDCHGGAAWRPCLVDPDAAAKLASRHTPASRWEADRG